MAIHSHRSRSRGSRLRVILLAGLAGALPILPRTAFAAPIAVGAGADYSTGPGSQTTRSAIGILTAGAGPSRFTLAGLRYDDNVVGLGNAVIGGVDLPMVAAVRLQASATRFLGEGSYRAWRVKAGPQFTMPGGQSVGMYYSHYRRRRRRA